MNQAEEDALVNEIFDKSWRTEPGAQTSLFNMSESIRLAIRAAVAAERERCANLAGTMAERPFDSEPEFSAVLAVESAIRNSH